MQDLKFKIELNVLNHLGLGLYSSTPAVVTEIISNAWDADAPCVRIDIRLEYDEILVEDDGHGMTRDDVASKFLKIGYSRRTREQNGVLSRSGMRRVMGRKGIGKLAMFSLADEIDIVTKAEGSDAVAFRIDVKKIRQMAEGQEADYAVDYPVEPILVPDEFTLLRGTRITLRKLNTRINRTEEFLRPRLARRFGVFSDTFKVVLNGKDVTRQDAGFYQDLQFLWYFDNDAGSEIKALATRLASYKDSESDDRHECIEAVPSQIAGAAEDLQVKGFIATAEKPAQLGKGDESLNKLSVFANGRLFQEDILAELGDARYFNSYLVGEIHADFLDQDSIDRATASREAIRHDDEKFQALKRHLRSTLLIIRDKWDEWRAALDYCESDERNPVITEWISGFRDARDRRAANKIMNVVDKISVSNDDEKNKEAKRLLAKSAIVGFEKLRARHQLDALERITDVLSPEFNAIFAALDDIEESYYIDIVRSRLEVIRKFEEEIVDPKKQEKVAQKYLFDHLWLLDPSWDRISGSEEWERTLTNELKRSHPDVEEGARLDIAYRTTAGRHVIIELKRPGLNVRADDLEMQGRKYVRGLTQYYKENPHLGGLNGRVPPVDVYFLISKVPQIDSEQDRALAAYNMKFMTYSSLISNAKMTYQAYLNIQNKVGALAQLLDKL